MDITQQIYVISCNRGWRLTWDFRQADVTWLCDVALQTESTNYACRARGRNKKTAQRGAANELAARLVQDGVLDASDLKDLRELDPTHAPAMPTYADESSDPCSKPPSSRVDYVKATNEPDMSSSADVSAQLQTLTEFVRKQTEVYSTVVKSQAELIARLGRAVQDVDQRIDLMHSELRDFYEWITNGEFVPADMIQSSKPDVDDDCQHQPHENSTYEGTSETGSDDTDEAKRSVVCLGSPRSIETEPEIGASDASLQEWLDDEVEDSDTLLAPVQRMPSSCITYELLGPTERGWNPQDNGSDFSRGFADDPVVRMGSGTNTAPGVSTVNTSGNMVHRAAQRTTMGGPTVANGPSNGYGIRDRNEQDGPGRYYEGTTGSMKKFDVQETSRMTWNKADQSMYGVPPPRAPPYMAQRNGLADSTTRGTARLAGHTGPAAFYQVQRTARHGVGLQPSTSYDPRIDGSSGHRQSQNHQTDNNSRKYRTYGPQAGY